MPDPAVLLDAVHRLADRFRTMPQSALLARVDARPAKQPGPGRISAGTGTRADAGRALADRLAEAARVLEEPQAEPRTMPDAGPFAVGDQIAVAGHDLATVLAALPTDDERAWKIMDDALAKVRVTSDRL